MVQDNQGFMQGRNDSLCEITSFLERLVQRFDFTGNVFRSWMSRKLTTTPSMTLSAVR